MPVYDNSQLSDKVDALELWVSQFEAATKSPDELTGAQRNPLKDSIYPLIQGYRTDKGTNQDYTQFEVGDIIDHIDKTNKRKIAGVILQLPFTAPADFTDDTKFEVYEDIEA